MIKRLIYRYRLWKICKKLKFHPYPWQKLFILGITNQFYGYQLGRRTGKTITCILYGLVRNVKTERGILDLCGKDPDCCMPSTRTRMDCFIREYKKVAHEAGIEVHP